MTLTIDFTPQAEAWIETEALRQGVPPTEVVRKLVEERLQPDSGALVQEPQGAPIIDAENAAAIALLDSWIREAATDDPEEIRKSIEEMEELHRNLNANRAATGERLVFPE
jgi:hypothetical protein